MHVFFLGIVWFPRILPLLLGSIPVYMDASHGALDSKLAKKISFRKSED